MNEIRKIMIATPCHDGKLPVEYVSSLLDTMRAQFPIIIAPVFLPGESMLPHARNYLASLFLQSDFDYIFYIDSDMVWTPEQFTKIARYDIDVISGLAHQKFDGSPLNFRAIEKETPNEKGLLKVNGVGSAFIKISKNTLIKIAKVSQKYQINNIEYKSIFEYGNIKGEFISEDIMFCKKLIKNGFDIIADTSVIIGHIGNKIY
jgi:hypothetical protein